MSFRRRFVGWSALLATALAAGVLRAPELRAQQSDSAAALAAAKDSAAAHDTRWGTIPARWTFGAGGYLPSVSTTMTLESALLPATEIDLGKRLGLASSRQSIDLIADYRFAKKNMLTLEFFDISKSATKTISDSLIVNDTIYRAGATLDTRAKLQYYGLSYRYYPWRRQRWEIGFGLGIDVLNIGLGIGVKANVVGRADSAQTKGSLVAPVPMLGFYGDWEVVPRVLLRGSFQTIYIANVSNYGGAVRDRRIAGEWMAWDNFGFGLGWHYVGVDIKKNFGSGAYIKADYSIQGLSLYGLAAFGAPQPVPYRPSAPRTEPPAGQDFGLVPRTISIAVGGYLPSVASQAQLETPGNAGDRIDLEKVLGLPSSAQSLVVDVALRTGNKSLITGSYFGFNRSGSATLSDSIVFGDTVYHAGATLNGTGTLQYFGFSYRYYVLRDHSWQLGAGIGVDQIDLGSKLGIDLFTPGREDSLPRKNNLGVLAPMLGLYGDWEFLPRFYLRGQAEWIGGSSSGYHVEVTDDRADVEWYAFENYGLGLGYHYVGANVAKTIRNGDTFRILYKISGAVFYLKAAF
jgi:hypothetical protein